MNAEMLASIAGKVSWLCVVIAIDVISGVLVALKSGNFQWEKLPGFMKKYVLLALGWILAEAAVMIPEDIYQYVTLKIPYEAFAYIGDIAYGFVLTAGFGSFMANFANMGFLQQFLQKYGFKKEEQPQ